LEEEESLLAAGEAWANAAPNDKIRAIRQLTTNYATILLATGMRPDEALKLKWRDIERFTSADGRSNLCIWISADSKTGRRDPIIRAHGEVTIMAMMLEREPERERPEQPVFMTPDGVRLPTFAGPFER
jgi:integrase